MILIAKDCFDLKTLCSLESAQYFGSRFNIVAEIPEYGVLSFLQPIWSGMTFGGSLRYCETLSPKNLK